MKSNNQYKSDSDDSQKEPFQKRDSLDSEIFESSKSEFSNKKESQEDKEFRRWEKKFGEYVYQLTFPFYFGPNVLSIRKNILIDFLKFLGRINTHWEVAFWDCLDKTIDGFHRELFLEIQRRQYLVRGRLQLCFIIDNISSMEKTDQIAYYKFQGSNISSGFKSSVVLQRPKSLESEINIGFGNILFIFVIDDSEQLIEEIAKTIISV